MTLLIYSFKKIQFKLNGCYGITQNPSTKDFMIIMAFDQLFYTSGNNAVDDFIRYTKQINNNPIGDIMEFVPYDQFKDIKFIAVEYYDATWIEGNIKSWNNEKINFKRKGPIQVVLKRINNSDNITSKELNEVPYILIQLI